MAECKQCSVCSRERGKEQEQGLMAGGEEAAAVMVKGFYMKSHQISRGAVMVDGIWSRSVQNDALAVVWKGAGVGHCDLQAMGR